MNTNTITTTSNSINYMEMEQVCASVAFPDVFEPNEKIVNRRKHRHPNCIVGNPNYLPSKKDLTKILSWWFAPVTMLPLGLHGETGTGKTEMLTYLANALNEPVFLEKITCGMTGAQFEGDRELVESANGIITQRNYSQAVQGYKSSGIGGLIILDEVDKCNEDLGTALHLFLEGKPWTLSQFKETVTKHPQARIAATANTLGEGGSDRYTSSQRLDAALRGRFGWIMTKFPDASREFEILRKQFSKLGSSVIHDMISTANSFRDAALGTDRKGNIDNPIQCIFSTRTIVNWAYYSMCFGPESSLMESLEFSFWGSLDPEDRDEANAILQRRWSDELDLPLKVLLQTRKGASSTKK
jgi:cobaltochelatase CobS